MEEEAEHYAASFGAAKKDLEGLRVNVEKLHQDLLKERHRAENSRPFIEALTKIGRILNNTGDIDDIVKEIQRIKEQRHSSTKTPQALDEHLMGALQSLQADLNCAGGTPLDIVKEASKRLRQEREEIARLKSLFTACRANESHPPVLAGMQAKLARQTQEINRLKEMLRHKLLTNPRALEYLAREMQSMRKLSHAGSGCLVVKTYEAPYSNGRCECICIERLPTEEWVPCEACAGTGFVKLMDRNYECPACYGQKGATHTTGATWKVGIARWRLEKSNFAIKLSLSQSGRTCAKKPD
ncbi:MAG: hypothetical protein MZW92_31310 [Comamonadaceae bacterium]|nr:hypothetical protein [Comamonadaceae bacterium]